GLCRAKIYAQLAGAAQRLVYDRARPLLWRHAAADLARGVFYRADRAAHAADPTVHAAPRVYDVPRLRRAPYGVDGTGSRAGGAAYAVFAYRMGHVTVTPPFCIPF